MEKKIDYKSIRLDVYKPIIDFYPEVNWLFVAYTPERHPELYKWIYNRFISMYSFTWKPKLDSINEFDINFMHMYNSRLIQIEIMSCIHLWQKKVPVKEVLSSNNNIFKYMYRGLHEGWFMCINVDTTKLKEYTYVRVNHDMLVYGVDMDLNQFYCIDYFNGVYTQKKINVEDIEDAISGEGSVISFKMKDPFEYEPLNISWISYDIKKNLSGMETSRRDFVYGIDALKEYGEYLSYCIDNDKPFSTKALMFIKSYINLMIYRCLYIDSKYKDFDNVAINNTLEKCLLDINKLQIYSNKIIKRKIKSNANLLNKSSYILIFYDQIIRNIEVALNLIVIEIDKIDHNGITEIHCAGKGAR